MKRQIVILANSIRPGGRCVAGICLATREWIRPVSRSESRAVPDDHPFSQLRLLDVVEIPLAGDQPNPPDRYQRENWFYDSPAWKIVAKCPLPNALVFCEEANVVLHTSNDRVVVPFLDSLPPSAWKSLQLIKAKVEFLRDARTPGRWRASFKDGRGNLLSLKLTDPATSAKLECGGNVSQQCLLTVSLTGPWAPADGLHPERCYKLVAGVIELDVPPVHHEWP